MSGLRDASEGSRMNEYLTRTDSIRLTQRYQNIYKTFYILKQLKLNSIALENVVWHGIEYKNGKIQGFIKSSNSVEANYKNGKLHGLYKEYKNNKLAKQCNYKNGLLDGSYILYYDEYKIEGQYFKGRLISHYSRMEVENE